MFLDFMSFTKIYKFLWIVFSTMITMKSLYRLTCFFFNQCLETFESWKYFKLLLQKKINLNFSTIIINECYKITFMTIWCQINGLYIYIIMNQHQHFFCSPWFSFWKMSSMLFSNNTFFTNLRRNLNFQKVYHHVLLL